MPLRIDFAFPDIPDEPPALRSLSPENAMASHGPPSRTLLDSIVNRATLDAGFRAMLLKDAASAIRASYGVELPEGFRIRFIESEPDVELVVLPPLKVAGDELDDDDLENVAGGSPDAWAPPPTP